MERITRHMIEATRKIRAADYADAAKIPIIAMTA